MKPRFNITSQKGQMMHTVGEAPLRTTFNPLLHLHSQLYEVCPYRAVLSVTHSQNDKELFQYKN